MSIERVDALIARGAGYMPRWGWHDDHREVDQTPSYRPALQQVRREYADFLDCLVAVDLSGGYADKIAYGCLQLGLGECTASHDAWLLSFENVLTLDFGSTLLSYEEPRVGLDIASEAALTLARHYAPYDMLFIDAGHSSEDARRDHANYGPMVRPGGIVAFHDALRRPGFEDAVRVWEYLETLRLPVHVIGNEVGIAWIRV